MSFRGVKSEPTPAGLGDRQFRDLGQTIPGGGSKKKALKVETSLVPEQEGSLFHFVVGTRLPMSLSCRQARSPARRK